MIIDTICATSDSIRITVTDCVCREIRIRAFVPLINGKSTEKHRGRCVYDRLALTDSAGNAEIPANNGYELFICRFEVSLGGEIIDGVKYVDRLAPDFSRNNAPYPRPERPLGTWCIAEEEDIEYMRMGMMMDELDEVWLFSPAPGPDDIVHVWNGREYRFDNGMYKLHEKFLTGLAAKGILTLFRFINRRDYQLKRADKAFFDVLRHPDYEDGREGVEMSGFNMRTEEGIDYYCACLDFLYSRFGDICPVTDIGNEVNSAGIWSNSGQMTCAEFMEEYAVALRLAWLIAARYRSAHRVDISLEMNFTRPFVSDPMRFYPARECLYRLADICRRDGDFYWGVSAHPYPEDLSRPDFYNDKAPVFSVDTPIITMKNLEVWEAVLSLPRLRYNGVSRRVIFDEQGFNTRTGEPETELQGAYAFVLAYLKIKKSHVIDAFLINRDTDLDDGAEYGLHLGLRYFGGYKDAEHILPAPGRRKFICDAIAAMGTEKEAEWTARAREYIGPELFDRLLDPPAVEGA